MRVLVTGGAGFIGSHFAKRLQAAGDEVAVLDTLTYSGNPANLEGTGIELIEGDICDAEPSRRPLRAGTRSSTSPPRRMSTAPSSARPTSVGRSSSERRSCSRRCAAAVPASFRSRPTRSTATSPAAAPRGRPTRSSRRARTASRRRAATSTSSAYARTFGVNASITRGSNTYGPNQYPEKLIPLLIDQRDRGRAAADLRRREAGSRLALGRGPLRRDRDGIARGRSRRGLQRRRPRRTRERGGRRPHPRAHGRRRIADSPRRGPRRDTTAATRSTRRQAAWRSAGSR